MAVRKKKPKQGRDLRTTQCDYCGKTHYVMDGGWVINGNGKTLCHGRGDTCFENMQRSVLDDD